MQIKEVFSPPDIIIVQQLAYEIWNEYYPSIIGQEQVDYMLDSFQTAKAILSQIHEGYRYFLLIDEKALGYMAVQKRGDTLFLSKIYVQRDARKKAYAKEALTFLKDVANQDGLDTISLTVNRYNETAIQAYKKLGFTKTGELVQDIEKGFKMDDFCFELQC